jgi:hypothetical protein
MKMLGVERGRWTRFQPWASRPTRPEAGFHLSAYAFGERKFISTDLIRLSASADFSDVRVDGSCAGMFLGSPDLPGLGR